jgi:hypothetical protein
MLRHLKADMRRQQAISWATCAPDNQPIDRPVTDVEKCVLRKDRADRVWVG